MKKQTGKQTRKKRNNVKQKRLRTMTTISIIVVSTLILLPIMFVCVLWWQGLLPTREELPRYKERLVLMFKGWKHPHLPQADVIGIDISHYQSNINFSSLCFHLDNTRQMYSSAKKSTIPRKVDFVIAKATEGKLISDSYYKRNKKGCRELNIPFGAYHFYSASTSATLQAKNFIDFAQLQRGDLAPILDIEPVLGKLPECDSVIKWLNIVERRYGVRPIIYTNENTYLTYFSSKKVFKDYPYWIARYGNTEPSRMHIMWQCTDNGRVGGISGPVDINIFKGTEADLKLYTIK